MTKKDLELIYKGETGNCPKASIDLEDLSYSDEDGNKVVRVRELTLEYETLLEYLRWLEDRLINLYNV